MSAILEISLLAVVGTAYSNLVHGEKTFLLAGAVTHFILEKIAVAVHAGVFIREFVLRQKKSDFQSVSDQAG